MSTADGHIIIDTIVDNSGFKKGLDGLNNIAGTAIKGITTAIEVASAAIAGIGVSAIKVGSEFEAGMSQVAATMGLSVEEIRNGSETFNKLEEAAKEAGATTQFSATQASEALNYLALAGYDADKAVTALPKVLNLAAAGGMELAYASDLVTDSMSALGLQTFQLEEFTDQMAKTAQKSNTSIAQLGEAILTVGGTAKSLTGGTVELNTALGILADNGIKGSEGGTALRNMILALTPQTDKAVAAFNKLGLESYDASGNLRPLSDVFRDMNTALEPLSQREKTELLNNMFNKVDLKSANALLAATSSSIENLAVCLEIAEAPIDNIGMSLEELANSFDSTQSQAEFTSKAINEWGFSSEQAGILYDGLVSTVECSGDRWEKLSSEISNSSGATKDMAEVMLDNLKGAITILGSAAEGLGIEIYQSIDEPIKVATESITDMVNQLTKAVKENGLDGLTGELGNVLAQIILQIAEFAPQMIDAAVDLIDSFIDGIMDSSPEIINAAVDIGESFINGIIDILPKFAESGLKIISELGEGISKSIPNLIPKGQEAIKNIVNSIKNNLPNILQSGIDILLELVNGIAQTLPELVPIAVDTVLILTEGIIDNVEAIVDGAIALIMGLAEGLINSLPILIEKAPMIVDKLVTAIINSVPKILQAGYELIIELGSSIINNLPALTQSSIEIVASVKAGILNYIGNLAEAAEAIVCKIKDTIINTDWIGIAKNIIDGLGNGIRNGIGQIGQAAKDMANSVASSIKNVLNIHSPSKVMEELGQFTVAGFNQGIKDESSETDNIITEFSNEIIQLYSSQLEQAKAIVIDGYNEIGDTIETSVQAQYDDLISIQTEAMSEQERLYTQSFDNRTRSLKNEIKAIEESLKQQELLQKQAENEQKLADKRAEISRTKSSKQREKAQKELNQIIYEQEKEAQKQHQQLLKDSLKEELNLIEEANKRKKEAYDNLGTAILNGLKTKYTKEKDIQISALDQQISEISNMCDAELNLRAKAFESSKGFLDKEKEIQLNALSERIESIKQSYENQKSIKEKAFENEKKQLDKQKEMHIKSIEDEVERIKEAADKKIAQYDREYDSKLKLIDSEAYSQISELQEQINSIDALTDAENKAQEEREKQQKLADARDKVLQAETEEERLQAQQKLNELLAKYEYEQILEQRKLQKEALKKQIEAVKENASQKKEIAKEEFDSYKENLKVQRDTDIKAKQEEKERLEEYYRDRQEKLKADFDYWKEMQSRKEKAEINSLNIEKSRIEEQFKIKQQILKNTYEAEKQNIEQTAKAKIDALQREKEQAIEHYNQMVAQEHLNAEARKMIIDGNNEDIINLLETYNTDWLMAGKSFADSLIDGLNGKQAEVRQAVNDLLSIVEQSNNTVSSQRNINSDAETPLSSKQLANFMHSFNSEVARANTMLMSNQTTIQNFSTTNYSHPREQEHMTLKGDINTTINLDGREIAKVTTPYISKNLAWDNRRLLLR